MLAAAGMYSRILLDIDIRCLQETHSEACFDRPLVLCARGLSNQDSHVFLVDNSMLSSNYNMDEEILQIFKLSWYLCWLYVAVKISLWHLVMGTIADCI